MVTYKGHTYSNGNVPKALLRPLDGENYGQAELRLDAADSWNRARAEVKAKTGITLTVRGWNRSLAEQERFFFERYRANASSPWGDYRWYKGVRYGRVTGAPAAIPGTSNHGWGMAVDIDDFGAYGTTGNARSAKATPILERHGWTDDEGSSIGEPWHRVYSPAKDTHPPTQEEPDMDATQAGQLRDTDARTEVILEKLLELHAGSAPKIDKTSAIGAEKITLRTAVKEIRLAVTGQLDDAVAAGVSRALKDVTGVDKAALTKGVVEEVRKALEAVSETEYVMTPKEN
jgi:hypothetical protein